MQMTLGLDPLSTRIPILRRSSRQWIFCGGMTFIPLRLWWDWDSMAEVSTPPARGREYKTTANPRAFQASRSIIRHVSLRDVLSRQLVCLSSGNTRLHCHHGFLTWWLTGKAGDCTNSAGTLSFSEIEAILKDASRNATQTYDEASSVQIVTFDGNQWVSYDNWASFQAKLDYANSHCIGG